MAIRELDLTLPNPYTETKAAIIERLQPLEQLDVQPSELNQRVEAKKANPRTYLFIGLQSEKYGKPGHSELIQQEIETVWQVAFGLSDLNDLEQITWAIRQLLTGFQPPYAMRKGYLSGLRFLGVDKKQGRIWQYAFDFVVPSFNLEYDDYADQLAAEPRVTSIAIRYELPGDSDSEDSDAANWQYIPERTSVEAHANPPYKPECGDLKLDWRR